MLFIATMARIIISILLIFFSFQSYSQIAMFHAHNQAGGCSPDTDVQRFYDSTGITDATEKRAICELVSSLKSAGIWSKLYLIYPFVGSSINSHSFNLKKVTDNKIVWQQNITHNATGTDSRGRTFFTSTQLIDSAGSYNVSLGTYGVQTSLGRMGAYGGGGNDGIFIDQGASAIGSYIYYFSGSADAISHSTTSAAGLVHINRSSQTRHDLYLDGTSVANTTGSTSRTGSTAGEFFINQLPLNQNSSTQFIRFYFLGDSLNSTEAADLYTIIQAYQTTLGRQL